ncbi:hypothetical protein [Motilimonas sp. E26]|uniref:hypothetical protein n=1 Tax=Motilimonas sp. E26 TaxID=2865674 RepID=UPI001E28695A|nr:hypothetical protein [Motilimonas sp. E26]MCE0559423.1 hypothetical protein [Motilimonas sp. E26]
MSMNISESTYYRRQHVTGHGCVLVSIKFGVTPDNGVLVVKRLGLNQDDAQIQFDVERHKEEIIEGVQEANNKYGGVLQVQEIEVVPNDYPKEGKLGMQHFKLQSTCLVKTFNKFRHGDPKHSA